MMRDRLAQPQPRPLAVESGEAQRALAIQDNVIDELPGAELRRLLRLIGGTVRGGDVLRGGQPES